MRVFWSLRVLTPARPAFCRLTSICVICTASNSHVELVASNNIYKHSTVLSLKGLVVVSLVFTGIHMVVDPAI